MFKFEKKRKKFCWYRKNILFKKAIMIYFLKKSFTFKISKLEKKY